ncbi:MAG TPA: hypothetical protein VMP11_01015 [Verrucomicrobiae bacterium]|nr:hypothetical protein [Verrucomicrobiae bacterium]
MTPILHPSPIHNRKSRSRFALLPQSLRDQLNRHLDDGWQYEQIREWLFALTTDHDIPGLGLKAGEPYSLAWTRSTPDQHKTVDQQKLVRNFGVALSAWYHSHFQHWRDEQSKRDREGCLRIVRSTDDLAATVGQTEPSPETTAGAQHLVNSLLLDALGKTSKAENPNPADLSRLAHAWARVNQTTLAAKRLDLVTEKTTDLALGALYEEMKNNPRAMAAFQQFSAVIKEIIAAPNPAAN